MIDWHLRHGRNVSRTARHHGWSRPTVHRWLGRFEDRIRREEAKVAGQAELAASSLEAQFDSLDDLAADAEVEQRLAELKKQS